MRDVYRKPFNSKLFSNVQSWTKYSRQTQFLGENSTISIFQDIFAGIENVLILVGRVRNKL